MQTLVKINEIHMDSAKIVRVFFDVEERELFLISYSDSPWVLNKTQAHFFLVQESLIWIRSQGLPDLGFTNEFLQLTMMTYNPNINQGVVITNNSDH